MPMVTVKVIEGVFTRAQKQDMIRKITDAMVEIITGAQPDAELAQALPAQVRDAVSYGRPIADA